MAQAQITINGTPGSNNNLPINTLIQLNNNNSGGEFTYNWLIIDQPIGSADNLSSNSIQNPTFTPKKEGTYLIKLTVNGSLVDQVIVGIRQLKTPNIRIPAAGESNEDSSTTGWSLGVDAALRGVSDVSSDANIIVGVAGSAGLVRGNILKISGTTTLKAGLPGEEKVPTFTKALGSNATDGTLALFILESDVSGNTSPANGALIKARLVGQFLGISGSGTILNQFVYLSATGTVSLTPSVNNRILGTVTRAGVSDYDIIFGGAPANPNSGLSEVIISQRATGGDGSSGNPWTGWESAINSATTPISAFFPAGNYRLATAVSIPSAALGSLIHGLHYGLSIITTSPSFVGTAFKAHGSLNGATIGGINFENISIIEGNTTTNYNGIGLHIQSLAKCKVDNVLVQGQSRGLALDQAENCDILNLRAEMTKAWTGGDVVTSPNISNQGTPGATTYTYVLVAVTSGGVKSNPVTAITNGGNAILSASNFNRINWTAAPSADHYEITRYNPSSVNGGLIGTTTSTTFDDIGMSADNTKLIPWQTAAIWLTNGDDLTAGASSGFTNVINIERPHINLTPGALAIIDDGGDSHNYLAIDVNGGDRSLVACGIVTGHILGGYNESQAFDTMTFGFTKWDVARSAGQCTAFHLANVEFSNDHHAGVKFTSAGNVTIEDCAFLGDASGAGQIQGCSAVFNLRLKNNYTPAGSPLTDGSEGTFQEFDFEQKGIVGLVPASLTLSNGLNSNIAVAIPSTLQRILGPSAPFSIGGFQTAFGTVNFPKGAQLQLVNSTNFPMTIVHEDVGETATHRINTPSSKNALVPAKGTAVLRYDATLARWLLVSYIPQHLLGLGGTPVITAGSGAGTGPTVSILGSDTTGTITVTTGTGPSSGVDIATVTFSSAFNSTPYTNISSANNKGAEAISTIYVDQSSSDQTKFVVSCGNVALDASTTYKWNYKVIE